MLAPGALCNNDMQHQEGYEKCISFLIAFLVLHVIVAQAPR